MSVETRHITKLFRNQKALDDVSFSIKKGELVGFLGPNGAGKSTMMKIITGFLIVLLILTAKSNLDFNILLGSIVAEPLPNIDITTKSSVLSINIFLEKSAAL